MPLTYLFRHPGSHLFLNTSYPEEVYDILCGLCGYPILPETVRCPRCSSELEQCPICSDARHTRSPKTVAEAGSKTCGLCGIQRIRFGSKPLSQIPGSFCTNLYGCPAGGLLLAQGEFAVLPENASLCPICREETLVPRAFQAFLDCIDNCLFCNTAFGPPGSWNARWHSDVPLTRLGEGPSAKPALPCPLCGRRDYRSEAEVHVPLFDQEDPAKLSRQRFLSLVEVGRALVFEPENRQAFDRIYRLWTEPANAERRTGSISVEKLTEALIAGTHGERIRAILDQRLAFILDLWERRIGQGALDYKIFWTERDD